VATVCAVSPPEASSHYIDIYRSLMPHAAGHEASTYRFLRTFGPPSLFNAALQHDVARTSLGDFPYGLRVSAGCDRFSGSRNVESYCFLLRRTV
jgi:hypothetical protein